MTNYIYMLLLSFKNNTNSFYYNSRNVDNHPRIEAAI